jgi:hypothetical protein
MTGAFRISPIEQLWIVCRYSAAAWEAFFKLPVERCVKEARPTLRAAAPHPGIILMPSLFS